MKYKLLSLFTKNISRIEDISSQSQQDLQQLLPQNRNKIIKKEKHFQPQRLLKKHQKQIYELIEIPDSPEQILDRDKLYEIVDIQEKKVAFVCHQTLPAKNTNRKQNQKQVCSICYDQLAKLTGQLECGHIFCKQCILNSSKFSTACPYCRQNYTYITAKHQRIVVQQKNFHLDQNFQDEPCYICGRNDQENQLLVCDYCNYACCHVNCDPRLNKQIPEGSWHCVDCSNQIQAQQRNQRRSNFQNIFRMYRNRRNNN